MANTRFDQQKQTVESQLNAAHDIILQNVNPTPQSGGFKSIGTLPKLIIIIGGVMTIVGFGSLGYFILSFASLIFTTMQSNNFGPPDLSSIPFLLLPIGAGLFFGGIILFFISGGMSILRITRTKERD